MEKTQKTFEKLVIGIKQASNTVQETSRISPLFRVLFWSENL